MHRMFLYEKSPPKGGDWLKGGLLGDCFREHSRQLEDDILRRFIAGNPALLALLDVGLEHVPVDAHAAAAEVFREHLGLDLSAHLRAQLRHITCDLEDEGAAEGRVGQVDEDFGDEGTHEGVVDAEPDASIDRFLDGSLVEREFPFLDHTPEQEAVDLANTIEVHGGLLQRTLASRFLRARANESSLAYIL